MKTDKKETKVPDGALDNTTTKISLLQDSFLKAKNKKQKKIVKRKMRNLQRNVGVPINERIIPVVKEKKYATLEDKLEKAKLLGEEMVQRAEMQSVFLQKEIQKKIDLEAEIATRKEEIETAAGTKKKQKASKKRKEVGEKRLNQLEKISKRNNSIPEKDSENKKHDKISKAFVKEQVAAYKDKMKKIKLASLESIIPLPKREDIIESMGTEYDKSLPRHVLRNRYIAAKNEANRVRNLALKEAKIALTKKQAEIYETLEQTETKPLSKSKEKRLAKERNLLLKRGLNIIASESLAQKEEKRIENKIQYEIQKKKDETDRKIISGQIRIRMKKHYEAVELARQIKKHTNALKYGNKNQKLKATKFLQTFSKNQILTKEKSVKDLQKPIEPVAKTKKENENTTQIVNYMYQIKSKNSKDLEYKTFSAIVGKQDEVFQEIVKDAKEKFKDSFHSIEAWIIDEKKKKFSKNLKRSMIAYNSGEIQHIVNANAFLKYSEHKPTVKVNFICTADGDPEKDTTDIMKQIKEVNSKKTYKGDLKSVRLEFITHDGKIANVEEKFDIAA